MFRVPSLSACGLPSFVTGGIFAASLVLGAGVCDTARQTPPQQLSATSF